MSLKFNSCLKRKGGGAIHRLFSTLNNPRLKARGFLTRCRLSRNGAGFPVTAKVFEALSARASPAPQEHLKRNRSTGTETRFDVKQKSLRRIRFTGPCRRLLLSLIKLRLAFLQPLPSLSWRLSFWEPLPLLPSYEPLFWLWQRFSSLRAWRPFSQRSLLPRP